MLFPACIFVFEPYNNDTVKLDNSTPDSLKYQILSNTFKAFNFVYMKRSISIPSNGMSWVRNLTVSLRRSMNLAKDKFPVIKVRRFT